MTGPTTTPTLRAARWSRVSSSKQDRHDQTGLPGQIDEQNAALAVLGAQDTGLHWSVTHSGQSVHETLEWQAMLSAAGRDFDVLLVAYTSRLARNAEELLRAERLIREAGASIYFCEEACHTINETSWEAVAREAVEAESYRRKLSRTMRRTYRNRVRTKGVPAGEPPYGFNADWTHIEDEATKVRAIFTEYVEDKTSLRDLAARHGLKEEHVKVIVRNPAYAGLAQHNGTMYPGTFAPIVDPDLWAQVAAVRQARRWAGGPPSNRPSMLQRRLFCGCGAPIRLDGRDGQGFDRVRHLPPLCELWGKHQRRRTAYYEIPLKAALSDIRLTDEAIERIIANPPAIPAPQSAPRFTQQRTQVAADLVARRITATTAGERLTDIDQAEREHVQDLARRQQPQISEDRLRSMLSEFGANIARASAMPYADEMWANLVAKYISKIEHLGPDIIGLTASQAGQDALIPTTFPKAIEVGGEGLEPPTFSV